MTETLFIDCAWTKPNPAAVKIATYQGVFGYISHDPAKDLSAQQARAYLEKGLLVAFVFETTADRATGGKAAGAADRAFAEQEAKRRGYPAGCPIFYAVDGDYTPKAVLPYFAGIAEGAVYPVGTYGSARVVDAMLKAKHARYGWQTQAWSGNTVSVHAHLYQRTRHTVAPIAGVKGSAYDENVVLKRTPVWGGYLSPAPIMPGTVTGMALSTRVAVRLVTRRMNRRRHPLRASAKALLVNLRTAINHALSLGGPV